MNIQDTLHSAEESLLKFLNERGSGELSPELLSEFLVTEQLNLLNKYKKLERMPELPVSIFTQEGQIWFKDFLFRIVEELSESYEAFLQRNFLKYIEELSDVMHFLLESYLFLGYRTFLENSLKESADLFLKSPSSPIKSLVSLFPYFDLSLFSVKKILSLEDKISSYLSSMYDSKIDSELIKEGAFGMSLIYFYYFFEIGLISNLLRNKKWKQSEVLLDENLFTVESDRFIKMVSLLFLFSSGSLKWAAVFYKAKNLVNLFRIESKY